MFENAIIEIVNLMLVWVWLVLGASTVFIRLFFFCSRVSISLHYNIPHIRSLVFVSCTVFFSRRGVLVCFFHISSVFTDFTRKKERKNNFESEQETGQKEFFQFKYIFVSTLQFLFEKKQVYTLKLAHKMKNIGKWMKQQYLRIFGTTNNNNNNAKR